MQNLLILSQPLPVQSVGLLYRLPVFLDGDLDGGNLGLAVDEVAELRAAADNTCAFYRMWFPLPSFSVTGWVKREPAKAEAAGEELELAITDVERVSSDTMLNF